MDEEGLRTTPNRLIHIGQPLPFDADCFLSQLQAMMTAAYEGRDSEVKHLTAQAVGTYRPKT